MPMVRKIEAFEQKLAAYSPEDRALIMKAAHWGMELHKTQLRASGEPYFIHPLQVAEILVDIGLDYQTVMAGLLHDVVEDTEISSDQLRQEFGEEIALLVDGVTKISILRAKNKTVQEAETIRKILLAMARDIRVILIKLADKLHNMRTLDFLPEAKRKAFATECLDIFAPLASRLGMSSLKDELEDLSLKHLNRDAYDQIKEFVAQKKSARAVFLDTMAQAISESAQADGVQVQVETRAKHFYSIFQKMKRKGKDLDEIFDLMGLRILCATPNDCYTLLGLIHKLWRPIEGRFKDYIAMPKANKYQSLHTTVMGNTGQLVEIQIRTHEMHRTAEHGIAAHWLYKKGSTAEVVRQEDLPLITKLKSWDPINMPSATFLDDIKSELLKDSIYVFTPRGDAIELPKGSTPIDFAYHIHTEVGNHVMAAKADGSIVPLKEELKNTQVIEIITTPNAHPHVNWLRWARTHRARSKIRAWLHKNDESLIIDKNIVVRKTPDLPLPPLPSTPPSSDLVDGQAPIGPTSIMDSDKVSIRIGKDRNFLVNLARCCSPTSGDAIVGYVSRGRGIIVHRKTCSNLRFIPDMAERTVQVEWETVSSRSTRKFSLLSKRTSDLFSEIEGAVRKYRGHLIAGKIEEDSQGRFTGVFTMELENPADAKKIIKNIRSIPSILNIREIRDEEFAHDNNDG